MIQLTHQDKISITVTFVFGFFAGIYLYLTGFATTFIPDSISTDAEYNDFVIVGESYGRCKEEKSCLSFQMLGDGSYRALFDNPAGGNQIIKEGFIKGSLRRELEKNLIQDTLQTNAMLLPDPDCRYGKDGINYRFRTSLNNEDYVLDTCTSAVNYSGAAWISLTNLWNFFTELE